MADINLFKIGATVEEIHSHPVLLERDLQKLIENNMEKIFGITFLKSEFVITDGRIDSLGLDENFCPVIFEYKRNVSENVINQGLFYLNWLLDHKADFKMLVMDILGVETANKIDWSAPCVYCIANDFNKYDEHAVNQMGKNIRLIKYKKFGDDLIAFEYLNSPKLKNKQIQMPIITIGDGQEAVKCEESKKWQPTIEELIAAAPEELRNIYLEISDYILSKGDDVTENILKLYVAYKKVKNIVCLEIYKKNILLHLKLNPDDYEIEDGFTRDMRGVGHYGTGDFRVIISNREDFEKAKKYLDLAYEND